MSGAAEDKIILIESEPPPPVATAAPAQEEEAIPTTSFKRKKKQRWSFCGGAPRRSILRIPSAPWGWGAGALLALSTLGILLSFPHHLEAVGDGYWASLLAATIPTLLSLFHCICILLLLGRGGAPNYLSPGRDVLSGAAKVGFCLGISGVTLCYSWEEDKVPCHLQDGLFSLILPFAILTHLITGKKGLGLKRSFALATLTAGVFLSVDVPLLEDPHRCRARSHYYYNSQRREEEEEDRGGVVWAWEVHLVWTLASIASIWLSTVGLFFFQGVIPSPPAPQRKGRGDKRMRMRMISRMGAAAAAYNAVKMKVIHREGEDAEDEDDDVVEEEDPRHRHLYSHVAVGVLWSSVATVALILALCWTQFIPGFGRGRMEDEEEGGLWRRIGSAVSTPYSWVLFISSALASHSFGFCRELVGSTVGAVGVACIAFPSLSLLSSFNLSSRMIPVVSGELVCGLCGLLGVVSGVYYFIKYDRAAASEGERRGSSRK